MNLFIDTVRRIDKIRDLIISTIVIVIASLQYDYNSEIINSRISYFNKHLDRKFPRYCYVPADRASAVIPH